MKKYSVVHLLKEDAALYHQSLTTELAEHFRVFPIHDRVPPHITIKPPFEANEYECFQVEQFLDDFSRTHNPEPLTLSGFGRFSFKTAYLDVVKSYAARELARECVAGLNTFSWMRRAVHEGSKLHASVARFMSYRQSRRVWRYLKTEQPHFKQPLDTLTLLKKDQKKRCWEVYREFSLTPVLVFNQQPTLVNS